jgi:hypothetical protein
MKLQKEPCYRVICASAHPHPDQGNNLKDQELNHSEDRESVLFGTFQDNETFAMTTIM